MERSYDLSVKVLNVNQLINFRISVDPNNFDNFMMKIKNKVSQLTNGDFLIFYTGTNGVKYCVLDRDDFERFVNANVEDVIVEEIERPALPALPALPNLTAQTAQQTLPTKMSCKAFVYRVIGVILIYACFGLSIHFCDKCTGSADYIDFINRHVQFIVYNLGLFMFMNDIWEKIKNTCTGFMGSLPFGNF